MKEEYVLVNLISSILFFAREICWLLTVLLIAEKTSEAQTKWRGKRHKEGLGIEVI